MKRNFLIRNFFSESAVFVQNATDIKPTQVQSQPGEVLIKIFKTNSPVRTRTKIAPRWKLRIISSFVSPRMAAACVYLFPRRASCHRNKTACHARKLQICFYQGVTSLMNYSLVSTRVSLFFDHIVIETHVQLLAWRIWCSRFVMILIIFVYAL